MGHNRETNDQQRKSRVWSIFRKRFGNYSEQIACVQSSFYQRHEDTRNGHVHLGTCVRYTPYSIPYCSQRGRFLKHDQGENMEREQKSPENVMDKNQQDRSSENWFKITIPFGIKHDESSLLNLIQKECCLPFTPVGFHYEKMQAHFFVKNASVAFALKNLSEKIWDKDNEKISIFISPSNAPDYMQEQLNSGNLEQRKLVVRKSHRGSLPALNIQGHTSGPDLSTQGTAVALKPRNGMAVQQKIHEENVSRLLTLNLSKKNPYQLGGLTNVMQNTSSIKNLDLSRSEVKPAEELNRDKRLEQEKMCAGRDPQCTTFPDKSSNISSILELFPKLLQLDPLPSSDCDMRVNKMLPTCKGSFFGSETLKNLILQFLQNYYWIYDYGDRKNLLGVYHDQACFSVTIPFNPKDPAPKSLWQYLKDNRNMKKLKDPYLRYQLLRHTKLDIVNTFCVLPQTQHDLSSFLVDMLVYTETMLCFSVQGLFKEGLLTPRSWSAAKRIGKSPFSTHTFSRIFIAIPSSSSILCIVNDELFVKDTSSYITLKENVFSGPRSMSTSSPEQDSWKEQQETAQASSVQSGINLGWSQNLNCVDWGETRATPIHAQSKDQDESTEVALMQLHPEP